MSDDSKLDVSWVSWQRSGYAAVLTAVLAAVGCEQAATEPAANDRAPSDRASAPTLTVVDPSAVTQRGRLQFVHGWELGRRVAAERQLPCLVFFTAHWCTYCKKMEATTFNDEGVAQLANEFVCILVDADQEPDLCRRLQLRGYPTIELFAPSGVSLSRVTGWQSGPGLAGSLRAALDRYAWMEKASTLSR